MLHLITGLTHWQIDAVAFWLLLQGAVAAVPEEIIMLSMGVLIGQGRVHGLEAFIAVECGLLPANVTTVFITSRLKGAAPLKRPAVQAALARLRARGKWVIALTRFTPLVRGPVYAAVGLSGMRIRDFFKVDAACSLVQVPALLTVGTLVGRSSDSIAGAYRAIGLGAAALATVALAGLFVRARLATLKA